MQQIQPILLHQTLVFDVRQF